MVLPQQWSLLYQKKGAFFPQARKMLVLLPCITEQLQDADSGARAMALPVLSSLLRLLERGKLSLVALELASNLPALFEDVRGAGRPAC